MIQKIVTNLETSQKLKDLGILQESCFHWVAYKSGGFHVWDLAVKQFDCNFLIICGENTGRSVRTKKAYPPSPFVEIVSAWTLTELCQMDKVCHIYWETVEGAANCLIEMDKANFTSFKPKAAKEYAKEDIDQINTNLKKWREEK